MRPVFEIGKVLMTILLRCKFSGDTRSNVIDTAQLIYKMGVDEFEARNITRKMDEIGDNLSASCKTVLDNYQITDERRDYIIDLLLRTYENTDITISDFFEDYSTEALLCKRLIATNPSYKDDLDQMECELYERLLSHSSALLFQAFYEMPEFQSIGIKHLNTKMDEVKKNIDFIIKELESANFGGKDNENGSDYENQYMRNIINKLNHVYLFGVNNMERSLKRYKLSIAYVSLELSHNDEVYDINRLIDKKQNIWIVGEAGAGKTTLIQWIAVQYARHYSEKSIVPIYVELRNMQQDFSLIHCINNIMKDSTYEMPQGWIEQKLQSGKAVILLDGFDEISIEKREVVLNRLEEIDPQNKCKKVYTSRPQITQRPSDRELLNVVIKPMNKKTIKKFLEYWHKAVLEDQLQISHEETEKTVSKLYSKMELNSSILRLASSPLLCAMICALHYKNEMNLPINKRQLYDECCKLLIENRDLEKGVKSSIKLSYEQKEVLLSQLALWMMINRYNDIDKPTAQMKVQGFASNMVFANQNDVSNIFPYLLERCGILREPEKNRIDFIHRSFEEYLAAIEIRRQNDWGFLESVASDDMWKETVEIAIGFANTEIASSIIKSVFNKSMGRKGKKKNLFLAFSYYNNALLVDYKTTEQITKNLQKMIPPQRDVIADLINIGEVVIEFLKFEQGSTHKPEEFVNSLKVLRGIGSKKALEMATSYLSFDLPVEAIKEYGMMLEDFSTKDLKEYDIPKIVEQFIYTFYSHHKTLHEGMLKALLLADDSVVDRIEQLIDSNLTIIGYTDTLDLSRLLKRGLVNNLKLYGDFVSFGQIGLFPKLNSLVIGTVNNHNTVLSTLQSYCHGLYSIDLIMNLKDQESIDLSVFDGCNSVTLIDINTEHGYRINTHLNISYIPNTRIGGAFLRGNVVLDHEECNGKLELLLNKRLYNTFRLIRVDDRGVRFGNLDEVIISHRINSGGIIKYISFFQNKNDVYNCVSSYCRSSYVEVERYLEFALIEAENVSKSRHHEKNKKRK